MFRRIIIVSSIAVALAAITAGAEGLKQRKTLRDGFDGQRLEHLQKKLNVTDGQMNGIRTLADNRRKEMEELQSELRQKREVLRSLMQNNPNPADVGNAALSLQKTRERARFINQRVADGVRGLLTPKQLQRLPKRLR